MRKSQYLRTYLGRDEKEVERFKKKVASLAKKAKKTESEYIRDLITTEWLKQKSGDIR